MASPIAKRAGFTLIELAIALGIAALATSAAMVAVGSITDANLRSTAIDLSGAIKMSYDRAIMQRRTQRIAFDIDKGVWWLEYTEDPFALSKERDKGEEGAKGGPASEEEEEKTAGDLFDEDKTEVERILEGTARTFTPEAELNDGRAHALPSDVRFSRIWTGHQEEWFSSGIAYLHFFKSGYTEAAIVELMDEGEDVVSLEIQPLTGRVRTQHKKLKLPDVEEPDAKEQGD